MRIKVIIPASGSGERFGGNIPKQFLKIDGKEIIAHTIEKFQSIKSIDEIIISTKNDYFKKINSIVKKNKFSKVKKIVRGGKLRQDSVYNALVNLNCNKNDIVLVHDAVRPFIRRKKIIELIKEVRKENCVILGLPVSETIKRANKKNLVKKTIERKNLWLIQTPQAFRYDILKKSFEKANRNHFVGTDESSVVEYAGYKVKVIEGEKENVKVTVRGDFKRETRDVRREM